MHVHLINWIFSGLCPGCSYKLNYRSKKKELKRISKKKPKPSTSSGSSSKSLPKSTESPSEETDSSTDKQSKEKEENEGESNIWKESGNAAEERSRDEDFEEYLELLLLWINNLVILIWNLNHSNWYGKRTIIL